MEKIQSLNPGEAGRIAEIAARESLGSGIAGIVAILFGVGLVASASAYLLTGPRVVVAMARDGAFPDLREPFWFAEELPQWPRFAKGLLASRVVGPAPFWNCWTIPRLG